MYDGVIILKSLRAGRDVDPEDWPPSPLYHQQDPPVWRLEARPDPATAGRRGQA